MAYLRHTGKHARAARPDIVLFDLNLPGKDGGEVLAEIKADPNLDMIPVVVLTTSESEEDLLAAYKFKANCYINKPVDFDQFVKFVNKSTVSGSRSSPFPRETETDGHGRSGDGGRTDRVLESRISDPYLRRRRA